MKTIAETEHYIVINTPGGNEGTNDWGTAMGKMLGVCENLFEEGYKPLHYVPRINAWVCEKPKKVKAAA